MQEMRRGDATLSSTVFDLDLAPTARVNGIQRVKYYNNITNLLKPVEARQKGLATIAAIL